MQGSVTLPRDVYHELYEKVEKVNDMESRHIVEVTRMDYKIRFLKASFALWAKFVMDTAQTELSMEDIIERFNSINAPATAQLKDRGGRLMIEMIPKDPSEIDEFVRERTQRIQPEGN